MGRVLPMPLSHAETQAVVLATIEALEAVVELAARTFPAERREAVMAEVANAARRWSHRTEDDLHAGRSAPAKPTIPVEDAQGKRKRGRRATQTQGGQGPTRPPKTSNGVNGNGTNGSGGH